MCVHDSKPPQQHLFQVIVEIENIEFEYKFTESDLATVFGRYGHVVLVEIMQPDCNKANIFFDKYEDAQNALADLNGKALVGIHGCLKVTWALGVSKPDGLLPHPRGKLGSPNVPEFIPGTQYSGFHQDLPPPDSSGSSSSNTTPQPPQDYNRPVSTNLPPGFTPPGPAYACPPIDPASGLPRPIKKYTCRYEIGIENDKYFQVAKRIIGQKGANMKRIVRKSLSKLRLRGAGSGYLEGKEQQESPEPLHLCVSCKDYGGYQSAVADVETLLNEIYEDYRVYVSNKNMPHLADALGISVRERPLYETPYGAYYANNSNNLNDSHSQAAPQTAPQNNENEFDNFNGVAFGNSAIEANKENHHLVAERNEARRIGDYEQADCIRNDLRSKGVGLVDEKGARGDAQRVTSWRSWDHYK